jgi:hypothetical protein
LGKSLGDIKWSKLYEDAVFVSSKFYFLKNEHIKLKGINNNTYSFEEIKEFFYNKNIKKINFNKQISFVKNNFELFEYNNIKQINVSEYDKRIFTENKKNTIPISIDIQTNHIY